MGCAADNEPALRADRGADGGVDAGVDASCPVELCTPYACNAYGRCLTVCRSTSECAPTFVCDRGFCVGTTCTAETAVARCAGYACVRGNCVRDCALGPCTEGFYCRGDTGQCVKKCTSRDDVVCRGYACDVLSAECEPYCLAGEIECALGYACTTAMTCEREAGAP